MFEVKHKRSKVLVKNLSLRRHGIGLEHVDVNFINTSRSPILLDGLESPLHERHINTSREGMNFGNISHTYTLKKKSDLQTSIRYESKGILYQTGVFSRPL
jgi:hypothetical protein